MAPDRWRSGLRHDSTWNRAGPPASFSSRRGLAGHPNLGADLADGRASLDRVRATVALAANAPKDTVERSRTLDIAGVRRMAAQWRRITPLEEAQAFERRYLALQPSLDESHWTGWFQLPGLDGRILDRALEQRADDLPRDTESTRRQRRADALTSIAQDSLTGSSGDGPDNISHVCTTFVNAEAYAATNGEAGSMIEGGPRIGPDTLQELICTGSVEVVRHMNSKPLGVGRRSRVIPPALRRFVLHRDGGCTVDGCTSRCRLQAHHVIPWEDGGVTEHENLTTVCWFHHHVVIHGRSQPIDPGSLPGRIPFLRARRRGPPG
ncbi:MAG: HNH endonuclease [Acidimicrobiia bacterium]|nr:HNH endonuclease [Acidimicrobiia bacterium]